MWGGDACLPWVNSGPLMAVFDSRRMVEFVGFVSGFRSGETFPKS